MNNQQYRRCRSNIAKLRVGDQIEFHVLRSKDTGRYKPSSKKTGELRIGTVISRVKSGFSDGFTIFNFACKSNVDVQLHAQDGFTGYGIEDGYVEKISPEDIGEVDITNNWYWSGSCIIERIIRK